VNLKRWTTIVLAALALAACGNPAVGAPVARLDNVILTQQQLDQRIATAKQATQDLAKKNGQPVPPDTDIERQLVTGPTGPNGFIRQNLILSLAHQRGVSITDKEVDELIAQFRERAKGNQAGITLEQAIQSQLGLPGPDSADFRQFVSSLVAQQKIAETLVTTDTVRQELSNELMAQATQQVDQVHAAHILVETEDDAKKVLDRLAKGEEFEALAKELSKDPGSAANGGDLGWLQKGQTVPEFDKAIFEELKPGETTKTPVKTQFGFHLIKVLEHTQRPAMTQEQAQASIEQGLGQRLQERRGAALQQLLTEEHDNALKAGRLVEPPAEPTAAPAPPQAQPGGNPAQPEPTQPAAPPASTTTP
jgi:peptidyl-prolyl cis-trans isomerase C